MKCLKIIISPTGFETLTHGEEWGEFNPEEPEPKASVRHELSEMYTQTERSRAFQNRLGLVSTEDLEDTTRGDRLPDSVHTSPS